VGIPLKKVLDVLKDQGIVIEKIRYTRPPKGGQNYSREMVVRIDNNKEGSVTLVVALFPELRM
jgi:hypothetical protein